MSATGCAVLVNINAGSFQPSVCAQMEEQLRPLDGQLVLTESVEQASDFVARAPQAGIGRIVVCGGDDTIRDLLPALLTSGCELGIVPAGTFNNLALSLRLPSDPLEALRTALGGAARPIDLGRAEGLYFTESAGVGYLAEAWARAPQPEPTGFRRWVTGFLAASSALLDYEPLSLWVRIDDQESYEEIWDLTVANAPFFANNISIAPEAELDDGWLDANLWPAMSPLDFLSALPSLLSDPPDRVRDVRTRRTRRLEVTSATEIPLRVDNTVLHGTRFVFEVLPNALPVVRP